MIKWEATSITSSIRTDKSLPEVIALSLGGRTAGELPVDFIFNVAHCDERSDNTLPTTGLDYRIHSNARELSITWN